MLRDVRYCLTLDSDTRLPRDAARELVGIILHPLNQPEVDPALRRVTQGYGILQPRVSVTMSSAAGSLFARVYAGHTGVDPYTTAVSDVYQDLFGEGIFAGKGLYHVDAFMSTLEGRVPENALLSHDLFEGLHARAALVSDIELVDDYPPTVLAHVRRQRRWVRGDWQILLWLFPYVPTAQGMARNQLPFISRWKILDNLRRSLVAPALLAFLVAGWTVLPGRPVVWTAMVLGVTGAADAAGDGAVARRAAGTAIRSACSCAASSDDMQTAAAQALLSLMLLPFHAWEMVRAIILTLARLADHASPAARMGDGVERGRGIRGPARPRGARRCSSSQMAASPLVALLAIVVVAASPRHGWIAALPFVLGWIAAPVIAWALSQPRPPRQRALAPHERTQVRRLARKTWHYFEVFVGPDDHWLPPDNFQEAPGRQLARRTSPTNIGMGLLSTLAARDLGLHRRPRARSNASTTRSTRARALERHEGHLLNWYDTSSLAPLRPRYVSTVDSGNLVTSLITLASGLERSRCAATRRPPRARRARRHGRGRPRPRLGQCAAIAGARGRARAGPERSRSGVIADLQSGGDDAGARRARRRRGSRRSTRSWRMPAMQPAAEGDEPIVLTWTRALRAALQRVIDATTDVIDCRRWPTARRFAARAGRAQPRARRPDALRLPLRPDAPPLLDWLSPRRRRRPRRARRLLLRPARLGSAAGQLHRHRPRRRPAAALVPSRTPRDERRRRARRCCRGARRCSST